MIERSDAEQLVRDYLAGLTARGSCELAIAHVYEHDWGWMFVYQSKEYLETGNILHAVAGNVPRFVTLDGTFHGPVAGSSFDTEEHRKLFEQQLMKRK